MFLCYRIRHFILAYFYSKKRDKSSWIVSHIELVRRYYEIKVRIYFYDGAFEENRALFFPKLIKSIKKNFDGFFFENKNDINKSNTVATLKLFNKTYKKLWLKDYLFFKKYNKFFSSLNLLKPLDFLKARQVLDFFNNIYDSMVFFWLSKYTKDSGFYSKKQFLSKSKFIKFISSFCKINFMRYNFFKENYISNLSSYKVDYFPLEFNKNKNGNLVDRWMSLFNIIPYQQIMSKFRKKLRYVEFQGSMKYRSISLFFLYSFHSYMSRYYMAYDSTKIIWKNWRLWSGIDRSNLISDITNKKLISKVQLDDVVSKYLKKKQWTNNKYNTKFDFYNKKSFLNRSNFTKTKIGNNFIQRDVKRKFFENKQNLRFIFKAVFTLIFISFFSTFRFNTSFDWKYWFYFLKQLQKRDYNSLYKYFKYRSIFTGISYRINMVHFSFILAFLIRFGGNYP